MKDAFGIPENFTFSACNDPMYADFLVDDIMRSKVPSIVYDLENIKVLLYNGEDDFIINTYSALRWINNMPW